ncbi:hypothetical protein DVQ97_03160 [Yersinia enterocolitica]|nr:hypothetical protein [Yersinia enterocolitica]HDL7446576.1 MyfA/PsaA family fimbrial adhesin [Yersinia enterocolitica]
MKEFAKKSLAIAVLMMTFGGGAHATVVGSQEVQARKTVERVDVFRVEFDASANKVSEGEQSVDTNVFTLKMSETAPHTEWGFFPVSSSRVGGASGGAMVDVHNPNKRVVLGARNMTWKGGMGREVGWYAEDTKPQFETSLYIPKGTRVDAGEYVFTAKAEVFAN